MHSFVRNTLSSLFFVAASHASAGVITQDGVVFTSTFTGNVLTLEIDAAGRSGGWAAATAIDALAIKTIGSFTDVKMSSSTGADWSLSASELKAKGCASGAAGSGASQRLLCVTGPGVALADNMLFTFTFGGAPALAAPHLKVHFINANGGKVGSLLSMDFPLQLASTPAVPTGSGAAPGAGTQAGSNGSQPGSTPVAPELIPGAVQAGMDALPSAGAQPLPGGAMGGSSPSQVPEPQTGALMLGGLGVMGALARRRRKQA